MADSREVTSDIVNIESVTVVVSLSGTYNGDLYMYLLKDTGFSVLLNRVGKNGPGGDYADDGMDLTFTDGAVDDVHSYRMVTTPSAGSPLLGSWQPDGHLADPDEVTFASPRSAMLSSFNGLQASGTWTLYVADMNGGDVHVLESWGLTITGQIPEPHSMALTLGAVTVGLLSRHRRRI